MEFAQRKLKGIEPIIAVVILVAVTLVIAIAVVGWIMGWWGTMGATESLRVYPDSNITITAEGGKLYLHIKNEGTAASAIYKVEVLGLGTATPEGCTTPVGQTGCTTTDTEIVINPGVEATVKLTITGAVAGANYNVKLYTRSGSVITAIVTAYAE